MYPGIDTEWISITSGYPIKPIFKPTIADRRLVDVYKRITINDMNKQKIMLDSPTVNLEKIDLILTAIKKIGFYDFKLQQKLFKACGDLVLYAKLLLLSLQKEPWDAYSSAVSRLKEDKGAFRYGTIKTKAEANDGSDW